MKKIRMCVDTDKTFAEGFEEYILDCKSRNLRDGTLRHYRESIKQIYKRVPPDTLISDLDEYTMPDFIVALRDDPNLNDVSMETYARDLKTLMRFFMKCEYLPHFEIKIPKADKEAIETYTDAELKRLLKKPDIRKCGFVTYRSWVIVNFLLSTGIRQNSLINIKIKDLDFDNDMVYINTTKNRKSLIIPLNEDIVKILHEYLKYRGGGSEDWLFCSIYVQLIGILLDGLGGHLCIVEHGLVFAPELEFVGAEDGSVLLESLGDQSGVVIDVADGTLLVVSHCSNLLLIIFSGVLCSPVF